MFQVFYYGDINDGMAKTKMFKIIYIGLIIDNVTLSNLLLFEKLTRIKIKSVPYLTYYKPK